MIHYYLFVVVVLNDIHVRIELLVINSEIANIHNQSTIGLPRLSSNGQIEYIYILSI